MGSLTLGAKAQEVHEAARIHRHIHARIQRHRKHGSGDLSGNSSLEHPLVAGISLGADATHFLIHKRGLLRGSLLKIVGSGLADLNQLAIRARDVEHGAQFAVPPAFLVIGSNSVAHEFAEHEDGRLDVKGHGIVFKRRTVAIAHEVVDEAPVALARFLTRGGGVQGLFSLRAHTRRKKDVRVARAVTDELHRHIGAKFNVFDCHPHTFPPIRTKPS